MPAEQLLEHNFRLTQNPNKYYSSKKVFSHVRDLAEHGNFRTFSKPDYLRLTEPDVKKDAVGNRMVLSKHSVWITVEE